MTINYRKDNRTLKQFKTDIKNRTAKEKFLVNLFKRECRKRGIKCKVEDYGLDNTGELSQYGSCKPDYKITIEDRPGLYEIKNSPVGHKWTFKVYNLEQYVKYNSNILLFYNTGQIDKDPKKIDKENSRWGIIISDNIPKMILWYKHYKEKSFGNKLCIQIPKEDFNFWMTSYTFKCWQK